MALKCEFCGKAPHYGNVVSHANNTRRRRWNPNLKRLRAVVAGVRKQVRVCTAGIRAGKVKKAALAPALNLIVGKLRSVGHPMKHSKGAKRAATWLSLAAIGVGSAP